MPILMFLTEQKSWICKTKIFNFTFRLLLLRLFQQNGQTFIGYFVTNIYEQSNINRRAKLISSQNVKNMTKAIYIIALLSFRYFAMQSIYLTTRWAWAEPRLSWVLTPVLILVDGKQNSISCLHTCSRLCL